ncbi:unnamed protein product [marine sediment metagenome]|uniref:Uncharacterized protein n=1 Tax=marine sediment metagenome TaxID=412755 RepID=X0YH45_9ZZZZ
MSFPYRPANGTEGEMFMAEFCYRCKHDAAFQKSGDGEDGCDIVFKSMAFYKTDEGYPPEWVSDDNVGLVNSRCTAFEPIEGS